MLLKQFIKEELQKSLQEDADEWSGHSENPGGEELNWTEEDLRSHSAPAYLEIIDKILAAAGKGTLVDPDDPELSFVGPAYVEFAQAVRDYVAAKGIGG